MDLPENKLTEFIQENEKAKWRPVNNHNITNFTEDDIKRITNDYNTPIGEGGFGQVYQGVLDDGSIVAVKKYIYQNFKQGFAKEVTVHCQINHRNVVRLLGYCAEENALTMVTEFISRGNLDTQLHDCDDPISLDMRLNIAIECSEALSYMHSMMYQPIIHGDIKPANILLDNNFTAKLSDFGISRFLSTEKSQYTTNVIGSRGYVDPEFLESGLVDPKNDVYSFGVVLLELITRKRASEKGIITDLIRNFVQDIEKGKKVREMFDAEITNVSNMKILDKVGKLAAHCLRRNIKERPEMRDVLGSLRILAGTNSQKGQQKTRQWSLWKTQKINRESTTTSSSTSTLLKRMGIWGIFNRNAYGNFDSNDNALLAVSNITIFTEKQLKPILNASNSNTIESGSFGSVYIGSLGDRLVVVRNCFVDEGKQEQFAKSFIIQSGIIHKNIVRFLGVCLETDIPMLVHEFVPKGSLHDNLHGSSRVPLDLDVRLNIAAGSAEGIAYMHSKTTYTIIHGDIKPANILLDDDFTPKIYGFGLATLISGGDLSYMDPVYLQTGIFTTQSDVYSFGVVLLELITRKKVLSADSSSLVLNFLDAHRGHNGAIHLFDTEITDRGNMELLDSLAKLAVECLTLDVDMRPGMMDVAERLLMMKRSRSGHNGVWHRRQTVRNRGRVVKMRSKEG